MDRKEIINSVSAYNQSEIHINKNKSSNSEEPKMNSYSYITKHKNRAVNVIVEFPIQTNLKAEKEFISRLKELYLEKIKIGSCNNQDSALPFDKLNEMEDMGNGKKS